MFAAIINRVRKLLFLRLNRLIWELMRNRSMKNVLLLGSRLWVSLIRCCMPIQAFWTISRREQIQAAEQMDLLLSGGKKFFSPEISQFSCLWKYQSEGAEFEILTFSSWDPASGLLSPPLNEWVVGTPNFPKMLKLWMSLPWDKEFDKEWHFSLVGLLFSSLVFPPHFLSHGAFLFHVKAFGYF